MARTYRRDARGRFAGGGYQGQTGGRGARLKASGTRQGGGAKVRAAAAPMRGGVIAKGGNGVRGSVARSLAATKRSQKVKPNATKKQDSPARWAQQERRSSLNQSRGVARADRVAAAYLSAAETAAAFQKAGKKLPAHVAETLASSRREYKMGRKTESINRKAQLHYHSTFVKRFSNIDKPTSKAEKGYRPPNARRRR